MTELCVSVRVLDAPFSVDKPFDYRLPPTMSAQRGSLVRVPFGRGNRESWGVVMEVKTQIPDISLKPVLSLSEDRYALTEEMIGLSAFLSDRYLCSFGDAVRCMMPHILRGNAVPKMATKVYFSLLGGEIPSLRSSMQASVVDYLREHGRTEKNRLLEATGATSSQLKALLEKGVLCKEEEEYIRNPYGELGKHPSKTPIRLSRAQMAAEETLVNLLDEKKARGALLHGVTGSGKTKIMLSLIDKVISRGNSVIMMVPEIALTPQTVRIFCSRYGERVAVIHSSLTAGERLDAHRRIARGDVDLVIGTRSAVFSPLSNLGLIIIDEEHEHTYKSEQDPKYSTREVAAYRVGIHNALLVLASATPSFESYYKAKRGDYTLVELNERYGGASLPEVEVVDMRNELRTGNLSPISRKLFDLLETATESQRQAILFLNRRGYNASLQCRNCGSVITCPHCSVAMTYHTQGGSRLMCHLCGATAPLARVCPTCGDKRISYIGFGTQKVESELTQQLQNISLLRLDADTTSSREDYEEKLGAFRNEEANVLLGTQMVTKGHDFPHVTLVGVMLADTGLHVNDFRASERTFSLLTQVIGRAGRAEDKGTAIIQTFSPDSEVIQLAKNQDYKGFYDAEIRLREEMCFPPFCDMVQLTASGPKEEDVKAGIEACLTLAKTLSEGEYKDIPLQIFGPMEAQVYKLNEQYRLRLVCKCRWNKRTRELFRRLLIEGHGKHRVTMQIDINPIHA